MIMSGLLTSFFKFEIEDPLKKKERKKNRKLRNHSQSLRREPRRYQNCPRGLDPLKLI